jgi:hypothetical protein
MLLASAVAVLSGSPLAGREVDFGRDVLPILSENCFACHGPDAGKRQAGLRLDLAEGALAELPSGNRAIVPGDAEASALVERIAAEDPLARMPPPDAKKTLAAPQIDVLVAWILQGAEYERHWAYEPIVRPEIPQRATSWARNPIDHFIQRRLSEEGLEPSPEADRVTLLRRLYFDLVGLPPSFEDVQDFLLDNRPDAYERKVDELLRSPHYGERMAIHWLDLVRYADSVGYHGDQEVSVSPFREYVIEAFNANMAFDRFTREQLAGDLFPDPTTNQLIASGYNRLGMMSAEGGVQPKEYLAKYAAERVRNASLVWMGATLGCAECHDHKYDPYTTKDFYSFASFFADIKEQGIYSGAESSGKWGTHIELPTPEQKAQIAELDREIALMEAKTGPGNEASSNGKTSAEDGKTDPESSDELKEKVDKLRKERAAVQQSVLTSLITVSVEPREMRVLPRGNWMDDSGNVVEPAVPYFLRQIENNGPATRLDLAEWLMAEDNPLTARVFVNRLWYLFFGRGLVSSIGDFGTQGTPPSHPELLNWLAAEFIESDWDVKHMVRLIVTSSAYRQSSRSDAEARTRDPFNESLARQARFRLAAEMIRDNALAVSGLMVHKIGGRSVKPYQPAGYYAHLNFPKREYQQSEGKDLWRRTVYTHWQRQFLHPSLLAFDAPTREECAVQRPRSNTPLASLVLLNDPIYVEAARTLAERILREGPDDAAGRIRFAYRTALSRDPRAAEIELLADIVRKHQAEYEADPAAAESLIGVGERAVPEDLPAMELAAWTSAARVLINSHEFITRN